MALGFNRALGSWLLAAGINVWMRDISKACRGTALGSDTSFWEDGDVGLFILGGRSGAFRPACSRTTAAGVEMDGDVCWEQVESLEKKRKTSCNGCTGAVHDAMTSPAGADRPVIGQQRRLWLWWRGHAALQSCPAVCHRRSWLVSCHEWVRSIDKPSKLEC